jgi:hypothetical protein
LAAHKLSWLGTTLFVKQGGKKTHREFLQLLRRRGRHPRLKRAQRRDGGGVYAAAGGWAGAATRARLLLLLRWHRLGLRLLGLWLLLHHGWRRRRQRQLLRLRLRRRGRGPEQLQWLRRQCCSCRRRGARTLLSWGIQSK